MRFHREGILIFYMLLLTLCDTTLSEIWEEKRLLYYSEVEKISNLYAYQIGVGGSYGHGFKPVKIPVFFHDGYIVRDCVYGLTSGAIYCRW